MSTNFRELIKPGTNFEFVGRARTFFAISVILVLASLAMLPINRYVLASRGSMLNWTIDFKGGTEVVLTLAPDTDVAKVRQTLVQAGYKGVDVSTFQYEENQQQRRAYLVRLPEFGAVKESDAERISAAFESQFADRGVMKAKWSGDTFYVRTAREVTREEFGAFLQAQGLTMKPWEDDQAGGGLVTHAHTEGEHSYQVAVYGLDQRVEQALEQGLGVQADVKQVDGVGAKAGAELRNNGIKSLLYAIALILLYIAFRFDFRYGPGTVAALVHDAVLVIGVFAVTWTEFSLTTVAALLTVIGYSMNDTVVLFDRIRENEHRLKDKKLDRVINISVNEILSRTMLTSLTTFVTTLAMNLLGTGLVKNFAFAMNVGIVVGTYSSIFIAAPIMLWLHQKYWSKQATTSRRQRRIEAAEEGA